MKTELFSDIPSVVVAHEKRRTTVDGREYDDITPRERYWNAFICYVLLIASLGFTCLLGAALQRVWGSLLELAQTFWPVWVSIIAAGLPFVAWSIVRRRL